MTVTVFCILLFAALLHASWNAIVKAGSDKLYSAICVSGSAALSPWFACLSHRNPRSPACLISPFPVLQVVYTVLVAKTYQVSDMSQTYPLMRGTAPLLVALISVLFWVIHYPPLPGSVLRSFVWLFLPWPVTVAQLNADLALLNSCFIAGYTLVDGTGVRLRVAHSVTPSGRFS
jgi:predicted neutral ceramidase superfamily lipid hydrolase